MNSNLTPNILNAADEAGALALDVSVVGRHVCQARDGLRPGPRTLAWRGQKSTIEYPCVAVACPRRRPVSQ